MKNYFSRARGAFTLLEILVVIGIIAMLSAILFPVFSRARESARQASCATNLQQIYFATQAYFQDERYYPDSLVDLLPAETAVVGGVVPTSAAGYLKSGTSLLLCPNDDLQSTTPRASYGALFKGDLPALPATLDPDTDLGQYTWNFWGYTEEGFALPSRTEAEAAASTATNRLNAPAGAFSWGEDGIDNTIKFSLSNRFAPPSTILTHCVFHRVQTATDLAFPGELATAPSQSAAFARDLVLRLDGSAKAIDVSAWRAGDKWREQTP